MSSNLPVGIDLLNREGQYKPGERPPKYTAVPTDSLTLRQRSGENVSLNSSNEDHSMAMLPSRKGLVDITAKFQRSAKGKPPNAVAQLTCAEILSGRLITMQDFRLFDSIGAIEIMDPKMDSGYIPPEEQCDALDMTKVLTVSQAVWIMEEITSLQLHWFRGHSLSQTLLTSYHIDNLLACDRKEMADILFRPSNSKHTEQEAALAQYNSNITQHIFRLFCVATVKVVAFAMAEIDGSFAPIYDEEDISMQTYGLTMFSKVTVEEITHQMSTYLTMFANSQFNIRGMAEEDIKWLTDRFVLLARMQIALLEAVNVGSSVRERVIAWRQMLNMLGGLDYSGRKYVLNPTPAAFNYRLQRKYASTQPLKPAVQTDFEEAINLWSNFIPTTLTALEAAHTFAIPEWVTRTKEYIEVFSYSRTQHFVYAQALAQSRFWNAEGGSIERFMAYDMAHSVWTINGAFGTTPGDNDISLSSPYNNPMHSALTKFYRAATEMRGGYLDMFKGLCSNRSRCRRMLCHVINGFDHLENTEARELDRAFVEAGRDTVPQGAQLWCHLNKLDVMQKVVELGFELDLYLPSEYIFMYWYLSFIISCRIQVIEHIKAHVDQYVIRRGHKWAPHGNVHWRRALAYSRGEYHFVLAIYAAYCILIDGKALPPPADAAQRWGLLMQPFAKVKSPVVPPWSTVKLVLSPTKRPMAGMGADQEDDSIARFDRYIMYINANLESHNEQAMGVRDLEGLAPAMFSVDGAPLKEHLQLAALGQSYWAAKLKEPFLDFFDFLVPLREDDGEDFANVDIEIPPKAMRGSLTYVIPVVRPKGESRPREVEVKKRYWYVWIRRMGRMGMTSDDFCELRQTYPVIRRRFDKDKGRDTWSVPYW